MSVRLQLYFFVQVTWRAVGSMMAESSIVLSAGDDSPSFVLYNLTAGTTYTVNATLLLLTDSTVFTTLPGTDSALVSKILFLNLLTMKNTNYLNARHAAWMLRFVCNLTFM